MRSDEKNYIQKGVEVDFTSDIIDFFDIVNNGPSGQAETQNIDQLSIRTINERPKRSAKRTHLVSSQGKK